MSLWAYYEQQNPNKYKSNLQKNKTRENWLAVSANPLVCHPWMQNSSVENNSHQISVLQESATLWHGQWHANSKWLCSTDWYVASPDVVKCHPHLWLFATWTPPSWADPLQDDEWAELNAQLLLLTTLGTQRASILFWEDKDHPRNWRLLNLGVK